MHGNTCNYARKGAECEMDEVGVAVYAWTFVCQPSGDVEAPS